MADGTTPREKAQNTNNSWSYWSWHDGPNCEVGVYPTNGMLYLCCLTCRAIAQLEGSATRVSYVAARVIRGEPSLQ